MENAADALKIAFAIFTFVLAITITFSLVSQAKSTADYILYYADDTNFYEHLNSSENNRTVSLSEVISSLHRYPKEVSINLGNENIITFDSDNKELAKYVKEHLLEDLPKDAKFTEEFVEVPISGIYDSGTDGSEIIISSGGKKVYITYTKQ